MKITSEHVKELADTFGENVLVPMPCEHPPAGSLWVISTENKHYDGAGTVYATSEQVSDLIQENDLDREEGYLTDEGAERIFKELISQGRQAAIESARGMKNPDGYTAKVMSEIRDLDEN